MCDSINCGFSNIDEIVGGFQASGLVVIGSRPGKGKSTFAKQIALNVAVDNQTPTMFFSPAESGMRFAIDLLCLECDRTQSWMEDHPDMVDEVTKDATERFSCAPLFIDDTPDLKIEDFLFKAKKMVKAKGIRLIIIDYVQFLRGPQPFRTNGTREEEMDCVAKSLKKAAEELKIPIIVLSQLQRGPDRPKMDDISDSKELKELADVIILMHNRIGQKRSRRRICASTALTTSGLAAARRTLTACCWGSAVVRAFRPCGFLFTKRLQRDCRFKWLCLFTKRLQRDCQSRWLSLG